MAMLLMFLGLPPAQALTQLEAEDFTLDTYKVEGKEAASGRKIISLKGAAGDVGRAETKFNGSPGVYTIIVNHVDENDGQAQLRLLVNEILVGELLLNQDLDSNGAEKIAFTAGVISGVRLHRGDLLTIEGMLDDKEFARVDYIQLIKENTISEAEEALLGPGLKVKSKFLGHTGTGYVDFVHKDGFVEWFVHSTDGGDHSLEFRYALDDENADRPLDIFVNEALAVSGLAFPDTKSRTMWRTVTAIVNLSPGLNTVKARSRTDQSGTNIDHLSDTPVRFINSGKPVTPKLDPRTPECRINPDASVEFDFGYADSYYGKVDPSCERTTLADWQSKNGFNAVGATIINAQYINAFDLGFGRDMHCLEGAGKAACYVVNDPDPTSAPDPDRTVTVTMEGGRTNANGKSFVAFYAYDANDKRINQLALDSEGPKSIPESCYGCHSGITDASGNPEGGQFLPFDEDSFLPWPGHPSLGAQETNFEDLNEQMKVIATAANKQSIEDLIDFWNSGDSLPAGWKTPAADLAEAVVTNVGAIETGMYKSVYAKYCRSCHVAQGPVTGRDFMAAKDFVDSTLSGLVSVCEDTAKDDDPTNNTNPTLTRKVMPHAVLTFNRFWTDSIDIGGLETTPRDFLCDTALPDLKVDYAEEDPDEGIETDFDDGIPDITISFKDNINPIWEDKGCTGCHTGVTPSGGMDLSGNAEQNRTEILDGRVVGIPGKPGEIKDSLILKKPSLDGVPHEGGEKFEKDSSDENKNILKWIQEGAKNN